MVTEQLKKIGKLFITIIGSIFIGAASVILHQKKDQKKDDEINDLKAELQKQEVKNEIETNLKKTNASDIISHSNDKESVLSGKESVKTEFRTRIRDRIKSEL